MSLPVIVHDFGSFIDGAAKLYTAHVWPDRG